MSTCDMFKNSQYVQNQKIGTSNPIAHFRRLQKQTLLLLDTSNPRRNQLNNIYPCKSFTISIWPIGAVSCTSYLELDLKFIDSLHTQFANYKVMFSIICTFCFGHNFFFYQKDFCVLYFISWIYNQGLAILSLHNMFMYLVWLRWDYLLHFTSWNFVVHVVWERCLWFWSLCLDLEVTCLWLPDLNL